MDSRLKELYRKKAEQIGKPEAEELKQLEDIYHKRMSGVYIGDMVFGANDGIITTFAIVSASVAAHLSPAIVIILGLANLIADGISMGVGNYLGKKSEVDYQRAQRKKEYWEVEQFPDIERHEIGEIFGEWGFSGADRDRAVEIVSKNKDVWVDFMMMNELGLGPEDKTKPVRHGVATFFSFFIAGFVPLFAFFIPDVPQNILFQLSILLSAAALFVLGALRSLVTPISWFKGGVEILSVGSVAAGAAYLIGALLRQMLGVII